MTKSDKQQPNGLQLTDQEVDALRTIVTDWLSEQLTMPPYDKATMAVIAKLDIDLQRETGENAAASREPARRRDVRAERAAKEEDAALPHAHPVNPNLG